MVGSFAWGTLLTPILAQCPRPHSGNHSVVRTVVRGHINYLRFIALFQNVLCVSVTICFKFGRQSLKDIFWISDYLVQDCLFGIYMYIWWRGRPDMLRFMGSQRVGHDSATELNWTDVVCAHTRVQLCPALCDPMDCSLPGSSVHGIFQARILEWAAISFSRGSSQPRDRTWVSHLVGRCFYCLSHQRSPRI